ncbi:hypothetical protein CLAFUW4_14588 [Fulvia fulva]|uniref:Uncharacterized protein n=1 Tax=Passalora fulva TaxID=5499 RepID=A0A9Q8UWD2_PASFU|nr:uncharacterized protein CLAFUR5_14418 [Fulvia fulva]KAK4609130.1 hypothetical protein CLAFUR4_14582 [Fulvia fulva]KAK4609516.1 hypothetical protein CLAFUR0_14582 [Fulvia fulva]UJO24924.1 hypothetical protein CLAFUR5_14418 [Fulvia fulva]WPV22571.1 hypothetical protein CLAFUW4_14588 [Fulvia fulva]WPV37488.1 hypothetical protein CLAFUW7_14591 [Fulvia fulva]
MKLSIMVMLLLAAIISHATAANVSDAAVPPCMSNIEPATSAPATASDSVTVSILDQTMTHLSSNVDLPQLDEDARLSLSVTAIDQWYRTIGSTSGTETSVNISVDHAANHRARVSKKSSISALGPLITAMPLGLAQHTDQATAITEGSKNKVASIDKEDRQHAKQIPLPDCPSVAFNNNLRSDSWPRGQLARMLLSRRAVVIDGICGQRESQAQAFDETRASRNAFGKMSTEKDVLGVG